MAFESNLAGVARVAFEAQTGEFNRDIARAEELYRQSTAGMSDASIKLELAQARLQRQVARGPANYQALARAELQVRRAEAELAGESRRTTAALQQEERSIGRLARGALAGSGAMRGLGRSVAFASVTFLGGAGLVHAVRESIRAAEDHQVAYGQLAVAVKDAGLDLDQERKAIEQSIKARERLGFTEEASTRSYITLIRATKDSEKATRLQAAAADIARARNVPLEQATNAVAKAWAGQGTQLKRLIPGLDATAKGYKLIEDAQRRTAGAADNYAKTTAGAQARVDVAIHQTEVSIGTALLPAVANLATKFADWADKSENQERIQRDVNQAVKAGTGIAHDLATGIRDINTVLHPLITGLGGVKRATELAFGVYLLTKISKARVGISGLLADLRLLGPRAATAAAQADVALNSIGTTAVANVPKVEALAAAEAQTGGIGVPGGLPGRINRYGRNPVTARTAGPGSIGLGTISGLVLFGGFTLGQQGEQSNPLRLAWDKATDQWYAVWPNGHRDKISDSAARKADPKAYARVQRFKSGAGRKLPTLIDKLPTRQDPTSTPTVGPDRATQIDLQLSRTAGQTGAARVSALHAQVAFDDKYIAIQERLLRTDSAHYKQHAAILQRLYAERQGARSELDQIAGDAARKEKTTRDKAERERQRAHAQGVTETTHRLEERVKEARTPAGRRRAEDALLAFLKRETEDAKLSRSEREHYRQLLRAERARERQHAADELAAARKTKEQKLKDAVTLAEIAVEKATKGTAAYEKAIAAEKRALATEIRYYQQLEKTDMGAARARDRADELAARKKLAHIGKSKTGSVADVAAAQRNFLENFQNIVSQYAPNYFTPAPAPAGEGMHPLYSLMHTLVHVNRQQLDEIARLRQGARFPESDYLRSTLQAV
jgi:hypothetical protein